MNKVYTAQEMREEAKCFESRGGSIAIAAMLRQAADLMEREKKYEYTAIAKMYDGKTFTDNEHFSTLEGAMRNAEDGFYDYDVVMYKRREVGEWEEVKE